jgi:hypothetical protein
MAEPVKPWQTTVDKQAGSTGATTTQTTTGADTANYRKSTPGLKTQTFGDVVTTPGVKTIRPGLKTQTIGDVGRTYGNVATTEDERITTNRQEAPTGLVTKTAVLNAGFTISFSIPIRGGLNAGSAAPQNL